MASRFLLFCLKKKPPKDWIIWFTKLDRVIANWILLKFDFLDFLRVSSELLVSAKSKYMVKKMYGIKFAYLNKADYSDNCDNSKTIDSLETKQELIRNMRWRPISKNIESIVIHLNQLILMLKALLPNQYESRSI